MIDIDTMVRELHTQIGFKDQKEPSALGVSESAIQDGITSVSLIASSLFDRMAKYDVVDIAHSLAGLAYIAYSIAAEYGVNLDRIIPEVHRIALIKEEVTPEQMHADIDKLVWGESLGN